MEFNLINLFSGVAVGASVFTITAMSIDRYLAIRYPMAFRKIFNRKTTILVSKLLALTHFLYYRMELFFF